MYIKGSLLSALLIAVSSSSASAYFAQANNAHVEFVTSGTTSGAVEAEGVKSGSVMTPQIMNLFEDWAARFERKYESLEEKSKRMLVWLENHIFIEAHNAKSPKPSYTLGHNEYSDMTHEEFRRYFRLGEFAPESQLRPREFAIDNDSHDKEGNVALLRGASLETSAEEERQLEHEKDSHDWFETGLLGPVRNQGRCGACWAFSAVGAVESIIAIEKFNENGGGDARGNSDLVIPLSEQDLIDCDVKFEKGCEGGLMETDFQEEESERGICSEADYPYLGTQGTCATDMCTPVPGSRVTDYVDVQPQNSGALKDALKKRPVTAAMDAASPWFQFYSSGIFDNEECGQVTQKMGSPDCAIVYQDQQSCLPNVNHGVLVVGYGTDESAESDEKDYFRVKNSWGDSWGEGGYFRLARFDERDEEHLKSNWGTCAIMSLLTYPVLEKV